MVNLTLRQLRAFLLVAQHRSFSRAAEALLITPSGLSLLIRELETQLGFRLFDRTTRGVGLTPYGDDLAIVARRTLDELETVVSRVQGTATEASRSLALGATPLFASNVLPNAIKEFRAGRRGFRLQLFDGDRTVIMQMIEAGALDLGLGVFFKPAPAIVRTPLFPFVLMVIRPQTTSSGHGAMTTWSALEGAALISLPPTNPIQQLIDKHLSKVGVATARNLVVNYLDTQIAMVEAGEGIAIIPSFALPACLKRKIQISRLTSPVVTLSFYQIRSRARKMPVAAAEFASFLQGYLARHAGDRDFV
jgi:LysR family carnitine catabolism transcriptional activator